MSDDVATLNESETQELLIVTRTDSGSPWSADRLLVTEASRGQSQPHDAGRDIHFHCHCSERSCRWALLCLLLLLAGGAALQLRPDLLTFFLPLWRGAPSTSSPTLYSRYQAVCEAAGVNAVMNRDDHSHVEGQLLRNWSVSSLTFVQQTELPACSSPQQLLQAVRNGQRRPVPGYDFAHVNLSSVNASDAAQLLLARRRNTEWSRSYFLTAGCSLRWFTGERVCDVLSSFSHVLFVGDSLMRHLTQGLFMLMTADLQYGAIPRLSYRPGLYDLCHCDGQYSEHALCRSFNGDAMFSLRDPRVYGVCTASDAYRFHFIFQPSLNLDLTGYCSADSRPRVLVFQAATHLRSDWNATNTLFVQPVLRQIRALQSNCSHPMRWRLLWLAMPAQSRILDAAYPHQSRERALAFNAAMGTIMAEQQVSVLDHWNLTLNAATSDGFHYLTDVNLQRANTILNLLSLWSESG